MSNFPTAVFSSANLLNNLKILQSHAPQSKIIPMIKANAYGHGILEIAQLLENIPNIYALGVARIDEALFLRRHKIKAPLFLLEGAFTKNDLEICAEENFYTVFHNDLQIKWLEEINLSKPITAWLKVNSGMNRLGFDFEDGKKAYQILSKNKNLAGPLNIMSHFASSEEKDNLLNQKQIKLFKDFTQDLPGLKSLNNSAGIINFKETNFDVVRPGIAIYGVAPTADKNTTQLNLKPVMTLKTKIISIHNLKKGDGIGYNSRFICKEDMMVGVAAIGYGDGYSRTIQDGAPILVDGKKCSLAGRVSMDMITINLTNNQKAKIGDEVILWGENLGVGEVKEFSSCSEYDLFCGMQQRVKSIWK